MKNGRLAVMAIWLVTFAFNSAMANTYKLYWKGSGVELSRLTQQELESFSKDSPVATIVKAAEENHPLKVASLVFSKSTATDFKTFLTGVHQAIQASTKLTELQKNQYHHMLHALQQNFDNNLKEKQPLSDDFIKSLFEEHALLDIFALSTTTKPTGTGGGPGEQSPGSNAFLQAICPVVKEMLEGYDKLDKWYQEAKAKTEDALKKAQAHKKEDKAEEKEIPPGAAFDPNAFAKAFENALKQQQPQVAQTAPEGTSPTPPAPQQTKNDSPRMIPPTPAKAQPPQKGEPVAAIPGSAQPFDRNALKPQDAKLAKARTLLNSVSQDGKRLQEIGRRIKDLSKPVVDPMWQMMMNPNLVRQMYNPFFNPQLQKKPAEIAGLKAEAETLKSRMKDNVDGLTQLQATDYNRDKANELKQKLEIVKGEEKAAQQKISAFCKQDASYNAQICEPALRDYNKATSDKATLEQAIPVAEQYINSDKKQTDALIEMALPKANTALSSAEAIVGDAESAQSTADRELMQGWMFMMGGQGQGQKMIPTTNGNIPVSGAAPGLAATPRAPSTPSAVKSASDKVL